MVSFVKLARVFQQSAGLLRQSTKTVHNFRHLSLTSVYNAGKWSRILYKKKKTETMQLPLYAIFKARETEREQQQLVDKASQTAKKI